jgi:hypothetical protein
VCAWCPPCLEAAQARAGRPVTFCSRHFAEVRGETRAVEPPFLCQHDHAPPKPRQMSTGRRRDRRTRR